MSKSKAKWLTMAVLATPLLVGCASSPDARLYILSADATGQVANWGDNGPNVLISAVNVPEHIKRSEIVFRTSGNRVTLNEYDRWAESVDNNISEALSENLTTLLSSSSIYTDDSNFLTRPDITLRIDVNNFGLMENGQVEFQASWEIEDRRRGSSELRSQQLSVTPRGDDIPSIVEAMSRALEQFSETLSQQLIGLQADSFAN
ncbi:MAG: PqiC family protein [Hyphomonadaceae bacterium]